MKKAGIAHNRRRRVAVVFTGGTISSVIDPLTGGAIPVLNGEEIIRRTPGLEDIAEVVPFDYGRIPSSHFSFKQLFEMYDALMTRLSDPNIDGAVLVQGTDTIEESSFFFDLLYAGRKPIVVTGSMRTADAIDFDGPRNLRDAVLCASSLALEGKGVFVVLAGTIEQADDVVKTHSTNLDTFRSLNLGSIGRISGDALLIDRQRGPRRHIDSTIAAEPIVTIEAALGADGWLVEAIRATQPRGLVVQATGSGNTHPRLLEVCSDLMREGIPVVLTTRASAGLITKDYGFPGSGLMWLRAGALTAGYLNGRKARIALALGIGGGLSNHELAMLLAGPECEY